MAILIADGGSTKVDWLVCDNGFEIESITTKGINPYTSSEEQIRQTLEQELSIKTKFNEITSVFFYGSGCRGQKVEVIRKLISEVAPCASIEVESDLLGAARSVCKHDRGIACILGTGSNSCLYNGHDIERSTPSLGYILGDEGGGAALGKRLLGDYLKGLLPQGISRDIANELGIKQDDVLDCVYKKPSPNRYLASFAPFISRHIGNKAIRHIVESEFDRFIERNVEAYGQAGTCKLNFVGSIAYNFKEILEQVALNRGYEIGRIIKSPLEGLKGYHSQNA